jgi:3-methylfumaryl-CoA hydratase
MSALPAALEGYLGRAETSAATVHPETMAALAAVIDGEAIYRTEQGAPLPPAWHWAAFVPTAPQRLLRPDGSASPGDFLPPFPGMRRMWAGSRLSFAGAVRIGDRLERRSEIATLTPKQGSTGAFTVVGLKHTIAGPAGTIVEEQDLVFREPGRTAAPAAPSATAERAPPDFARAVQPDPVLLFRFSAVTFNAHRIHYDEPYVRLVERYPGLVVHGPLQAILLLDLLHRHDPAAPVLSFDFRAQSPAFVQDRLDIRGKARDGGYELWIDSAGRVASRMRVTME